MAFSKKVFIAIFLSAFLIGSALSFIAYFYSTKLLKEQFLSKYKGNSQILSKTLSQLDQRTEEFMLNAAKVVVEKEARLGLLSTKDLKSLRDELGVTHIFIINKNGDFIRSTNESPQLIPNLFSFSKDYKKLLTGESEYEATPIIQPHPEPKPFKFLLIPNQRRNRIIEIGVRVDFIAKTLVEAISMDPNINSISLYAPNGVSLGQFGAKGIRFKTQKLEETPLAQESWTEERKQIKFFNKVTSSQSLCPQCHVGKSSSRKSYFYILESQVSKKELTNLKQSLSVGLAFLIFINFFLAYPLSQYISRKLVKNVELAVKRVRLLKQNSTLSQRIHLQGNDEVAYLSKEFDHLLETLESSQEKILEAQKVETKVQVAKEVAHNIKSPLYALEMLISSHPALPSKLKKSLEGSISEINALVKKLSEANSDFVLNMNSQTAETQVTFLPALLKEVVEQKQFEFSNSNMQIEFVSHGDSHKKYVKINPVEFRIMLSNLINNARESYELDYGKIFIKCYEQGETCIVEVIDHGVGIPEEYLDKLGKERITFKGEKGRGTGLLQAFRSIQNWNGQIVLHSNKGCGTTVTIKIPSLTQDLRMPPKSLVL